MIIWNIFKTLEIPHRVSTRSLTSLVYRRQISNLYIQAVGSISNDALVHSHESDLCDQGAASDLGSGASIRFIVPRLRKNAQCVISNCPTLKVLRGVLGPSLKLILPITSYVQTPSLALLSRWGQQVRIAFST